MKKRALTILLALALCAQLQPALPSFAAEPEQVQTPQEGTADTPSGKEDLLPEENQNEDSALQEEEQQPVPPVEEQTPVQPDESQGGSDAQQPHNEDKQECSCTTPCTEDAVNTACPVCGVEGAQLSDCKGQASEEQSAPMEPLMPAAQTSDGLGSFVEESTSSGGNVLTTYVNADENNQQRTIHWVKGITPPRVESFKKDVTAQKYIEYIAPYEENHGWYDANKHRPGDQNLCFVASTANSLEWWMDQNEARIRTYLESGNQSSYFTEKKKAEVEAILDQKNITQQNSLIFKKYFQVFQNRKEGFWTDLLIAHFINGYPINHDKHGTIDPSFTDGENLIKNGPNDQGGYFFDVFGKQTLSYRYLNISSYREMKELLGKIDQGEILMMTYETPGNKSHVVTLWGAEYNEKNDPVAVYYTDSDDIDSVSSGMRRYKLINKNGLPYITTDSTNAGGSRVVAINNLPLGTDKQWEEASSVTQKELILKAEKLVYNGREQTAVLTAENIRPGDEVTITASGAGTDAGEYPVGSVTIEGRDSGRYTLPAEPPKSFVIEKAAPTVELSAQLGQDKSIVLLASVTGVADETLEGTIEFFDGKQSVHSMTLGNGRAEWTMSSPSVQKHCFRAVFTPQGTTEKNYRDAQSTVVSLDHTKQPQAAPQRPSVERVQEHSIELAAIEDSAGGAKAEYSINGGQSWQSGPSFTELEAGTGYTFHARYPQTDTHNASAISEELTAYTLPSILSDTLPNAMQGAAYEYTLTAGADPSAAVTWSIEDSLPAGLVLDADSGRIYGTPTQGSDGQISFTVRASANGVSQTKTLYITIDPAPEHTTLVPSTNKLHGGGEITLTLMGLPESTAAELSSSEPGLTLTPNGTHSWRVSLPNKTKTYTFTASFADEHSGEPSKAQCQVEVTEKTSGGSSGGSSSGGHSGGGSHGSDREERPSHREPAARPDKSSSHVDRDGSVNAAKVSKEIEKAIADGKKKASVVVENAVSVSPSTMKEMAQAAAEKGASATLMADTVVNGKTEGRLYLDAAKASQLGAQVKLGVSTSDASARSVKKLFETYYTNRTAVVHLAHEGSYGMRVQVAARVDLREMNVNNLCFYRYDRARNTFTRLRGVSQWVDANGFLHFDTLVGGDIIISDGALTSR